MIISGLTERQLIRGDAGVPVLQDIPGIQYMFSTKSNTDFFRTVVVMITPRRPGAIDTLDTNVLFKSFKGSDLVDTNWSTKSRLKVILHDIGGLLFH